MAFLLEKKRLLAILDAHPLTLMIAQATLEKNVRFSATQHY